MNRPALARSAALTHPGLVRRRNEDSYLTDDRRGIWAVADGMGGHEGGAEASAIVVTALHHVRTGWATAHALAEDVIGRIEDAHEAIRRENVASGRSSSGATVVCVARFDRHALVAWCGDSRVYRMRRGRGLRRLTRDHSVVQDLIDAGRLDPREAESHPQAHVLTRAVGARLELDFTQLEIEPGDRLVLCSDGLTRPVSEEAMAGLLLRSGGAEPACKALVESALRQGGPDNVTVVVVDFQ